MSGVKGDACGNRKARASRLASRGAKTPLRGVFRAGEIPAQFFYRVSVAGRIYAALQVDRKRDMASGCGPGVPGPYGAAMGKRDMAVSFGGVWAPRPTHGF